MEYKPVIYYKRPEGWKPEPTFSDGRWIGHPRCTAWNARSNRQCRNLPMIGKTKCKYHGGASLRGIASPSWKTGRFSNTIPARLTESFNLSLSNPDLLELRTEIALLDARTEDLLSHAQTGESGQLLSDLSDLADSVEIATQLQRTEKNETKKHEYAIQASEALNKLFAIIRGGKKDFYVWQEIKDNLETRRRLVETERRRLIDMQTMVTSEQAISLMQALSLAVRNNVSDTTTLNAIQTEFTRLVSANRKPNAQPANIEDITAE